VSDPRKSAPLPGGGDLEAWAAEHLGDGVVLRHLVGDASTRVYHRAALPGGGTMVLMVTGEAFPPGDLPWLVANRVFLALALPVPQVLLEDAARGIVGLEDLGDELLEGVVRKEGSAGAETVEGYYRQALGMLRSLRRTGTPRADELRTAGSALDASLFHRELEFFREHLLEGHLGYAPGAGARKVLDHSLRLLAEEAAAGPRVLCHRDFHARNLIVRDSRLRLVDHQDARLGPDLYDLASLLRDPYAELPADLESAFLAEFLRDAYFAVSGEDHLARFERVALQRDLKALGTYGHQATVRGKTDYLAYVPRAAALVRRSIERLPGRRDLLEILGEAGLFTDRSLEDPG
jgi:aminoglycoside/choline kinase family phosphotransferase